jgi:hypothetical protein
MTRPACGAAQVITTFNVAISIDTFPGMIIFPEESIHCTIRSRVPSACVVPEIVQTDERV